MDLKSANGTFLNGVKLDDSRFVELKHKDLIKFGSSTREYIVLNETIE
jgi:smad nuclear-interacting protein 1